MVNVYHNEVRYNKTVVDFILGASLSGNISASA